MISVFIKKSLDYFGTAVTSYGFLRKYKIKEGDIIIDAGAYLGGFTLMAAKKVGKKGKVIAFEPDPQNFNILQKNVQNSNFSNIILINKAILNKIGQTNFFPNNSKSIVNNQSAGIKIQTTTLDNEITKIGLITIDFVKMDIEGSELEAFEGMRKMLEITKNFAIACYHERMGQKTGEILKPMLCQIGFLTEIGYIMHPTLYAHK
ncbi:MAG: FkbM family methyltransferase [Patescibacteria group bacterium]